MIEIGILFFLLPYKPISAQIVPDATLPNNSLTTEQGSTVLVEGGTANGSNLFHSFEQFSIPTGSTAHFNNAVDVHNIFSRVTGGSTSNIDGVIRANGSANLFLLNPNGIIFGPNAQLNIGGSFVGSTASSINFADGTQFSATPSQPTTLLTVSVPIGLGFGSNPGAIRVQGVGHNVIQPGNARVPFISSGPIPSGLELKPGHTLALIGGDITFTGGIVSAPSGRIELGSVASGQVSISSNSSLEDFSLSYDEVQSFQNMKLERQSLINASGSQKGNIRIFGKNVELTDASIVFIENQGFSSLGTIDINASESLKITGATEFTPILPNNARQNGGIISQSFNGKGADITISGEDVVVQNAGRIVSSTFGTGTGGSVTINTSDSIQILGSSPLNPFYPLGSLIVTLSAKEGSAGNVTAITKHLLNRDGGSLGSVTVGKGLGGNVRVNASESVSLIGFQPVSLIGSIISSAAQGSGNGGQIQIDTKKVILQDGGRIDASTLTSGAAGSLLINASDSIKLSGTIPGSVNPSLIISSAAFGDIRLRQLLGLSGEVSGTSGSLTINTNKLSVTDGAQISVRNDGTGNAGTLQINANSINLDNQSGITAATAASQGGEIGEVTLKTQNLQLRHNSGITTKAEGGSARGSSITIDTDTLVALEDSDIDADAAGGSGGRVRINAQGIFGIEPRSKPTSESDITATSGVGINGEIEINTLDFDARNTLTPLTSSFVSTEQVVEGSCLARRNRTQDSFIVTGNGGLPITPYSGIEEWEALTGRQAVLDESVQSERSSTLNPSIVAPASWKPGDPIVEAQGIVKTADGRTLLDSLPEQVAISDAQALVCSATAELDS